MAEENTLVAERTWIVVQLPLTEDVAAVIPTGDIALFRHTSLDQKESL